MSETNGHALPWTTEAAAVLSHGRLLFSVGAEGGLCRRQREAVAERLVAALNAAEGISVEVLTGPKEGAGHA